jgi:hypothetical protein
MDGCHRFHPQLDAIDVDKEQLLLHSLLSKTEGDIGKDLFGVPEALALSHDLGVKPEEQKFVPPPASLSDEPLITPEVFCGLFVTVRCLLAPRVGPPAGSVPPGERQPAPAGGGLNSKVEADGREGDGGS